MDLIMGEKQRKKKLIAPISKRVELNVLFELYQVACFFLENIQSIDSLLWRDIKRKKYAVRIKVSARPGVHL